MCIGVLWYCQTRSRYVDIQDQNKHTPLHLLNGWIKLRTHLQTFTTEVFRSNAHANLHNGCTSIQRSCINPNGFVLIQRHAKLHNGRSKVKKLLTWSDRYAMSSLTV